MPIPYAAKLAAIKAQHAVITDKRDRVRLVAGPGSGKSRIIEELVCRLISEGLSPEAIFAISFTRASAADLGDRIRKACKGAGHAGEPVNVSTVHALALRILKKAKLLRRYPVSPTVLDDWELQEIIDAEFQHASAIASKYRRAEIRGEWEAYWSTGTWGPPNYIPPDPPITADERNAFAAFHEPTTQTYACVLPGEIVRQCVTEMKAGTLDPVSLLNITHLIVDEFQDLNPTDLEFIHDLIERGVPTLVGGDDDQSIYSFRFATPSGIQEFTKKYSDAGSHTLEGCFRCLPAVLDTATSLIEAYPSPSRIPKQFHSLYEGSVPPAAGVVHRWQFVDAAQEANAIAASCKALLDGGLPPDEILILLSNRNVQRLPLEEALTAADVPFDVTNRPTFFDTDSGRLTCSILRIIANEQDYMAHRVLLGTRRGVGTKTCFKIREAVVSNSLNYGDLFYSPLPKGVFKGRESTALEGARDIVVAIRSWDSDDLIKDRIKELAAIIAAQQSTADADELRLLAEDVPNGATLDEFRQYLTAATDETRRLVQKAIHERLGLGEPSDPAAIGKVRLMTMHGAKGLTCKFVMIPGLEEEVLPGERRKPYPGLVLEAARLLYVSISRARVACICSFARKRLVNGIMERHTASRFAKSLGGAFSNRTSGLTAAEAATVVELIGLLD